MRITPLTVLIFALVAGGAWFLFPKEDEHPERARPDRNAGVETGPVEEAITTMRRDWDVADLDGLRALTVETDEDDDSGGAIGYLEKRLSENGWKTEIPIIESISMDKTDTIRVTLTCKLAGISATHPLVVYWEWQDDAWRIATWKIPLTD